MSRYTLSVKKYGEVTEDENVSVDPDWTLEKILSIVNAHNSGAFNAEDFVWMGYKDSYCFVPDSAPALVWTLKN